jgi:hypothetical protein
MTGGLFDEFPEAVIASCCRCTLTALLLTSWVIPEMMEVALDSGIRP